MSDLRLHTGPCDVFGIEYPAIQALMGGGLAPAVLAAAVSRAGGEQRPKLALGGTDGTGACQPPTVLYDVPPAPDVMRNMEIFAPVFPVAPFSSDEEAVALSNASRYGLNSGVFTSDKTRALRMAANLQASIVVINGTRLFHPDIAPFGGYKMSDMGRERLVISLDAVIQPTAVTARNASVGLTQVASDSPGRE